MTTVSISVLQCALPHTTCNVRTFWRDPLSQDPQLLAGWRSRPVGLTGFGRLSEAAVPIVSEIAQREFTFCCHSSSAGTSGSKVFGKERTRKISLSLKNLSKETNWAWEEVDHLLTQIRRVEINSNRCLMFI